MPDSMRGLVIHRRGRRAPRRGMVQAPGARSLARDSFNRGAAAAQLGVTRPSYLASVRTYHCIFVTNASMTHAVYLCVVLSSIAPAIIPNYTAPATKK